jgi:hypothetical protein
VRLGMRGGKREARRGKRAGGRAGGPVGGRAGGRAGRRAGGRAGRVSKRPFGWQNRPPLHGLRVTVGLALDASIAGFSKLVLPPRSVVQGCKSDCSLYPSTSAVCRRLARSTQASLASLSWCYHRGLRCRGASLTAASVLRRRLCAVAALALVASVAGFSKLVRGAGVQV